MNTTQIARAINRNYIPTYQTLIKLKAKGLIDCVRVVEFLGNGISGIEVLYWFIKGNKREAVKLLKLVAKQRKVKLYVTKQGF